MADKDLIRRIEQLTKIVENLSVATSTITPVAPIAPIAPLAPLTTPMAAHVLADHDLLQRVDGKVDGLGLAIKELKDGTAAQIADHETRIRTIEKQQESEKGGISLTNRIVYGACAVVLVSVLSGLVYLVVKQ
jgi:hypothetical protein